MASPKNSGLTISNLSTTNNFAGYDGGGIFCENSSPSISNNTITNNSATNGGGGGIFCGQSNSTITNNTISNNNSSNGGALYCSNTSNPTLRNCIIWGNTASTGGAQVFLNDEPSDPPFYYCDVQGGTANFELNGNFYTGTYQNNINTNPLFVSPSAGSGTSYNAVTADWSLQISSSCINAGDPNGTYPATDIAGNPRISNGIIDIGAYEYQDPLPVELTSFAASANGSAVTLNWHTATEVNNYGFEIERRTISNQQITQSSIDNWQKIGFLKGAGTNNAPREYSYSDAISSTGRYVYRLKQVDIDGSFKYSQSVEITTHAPEQNALNQNYPNPFNPSTTISFSLPTNSFVLIKVFDQIGREIATIVSEEMSAGSYSRTWNAVSMPSGVYFYRLQAGSFSETKKLILLR